MQPTKKQEEEAQELLNARPPGSGSFQEFVNLLMSKVPDWTPDGPHVVDLARI